MRRGQWHILFYACVVAGCSRSGQLRPVEPMGVVGTWRITEYWNRSSPTRPLEYPFGERPCGYIIYTATGHMSAQVASAPIAPILPLDSLVDGNPRGEEAIAMLGRSVSYFGTYTIDAERRVVVHNVQADMRRRYTGRAEDRLYRLNGDSLILGNDSTWRRVLLREKTGSPPNPACRLTTR